MAVPGALADTPAVSSGPGVQIRFDDGTLVEFRPDGEWPRVARIRFQGVDIKGLRARGYTLVSIPQMLRDAPPKRKKQAPFGSGPGL